MKGSQKMAIKRVSITIRDDWIQSPSNATNQRLCILVIANYVGIFGHHQGTVKWWPNLFKPSDDNQICLNCPMVIDFEKDFF
jgi:hypothetical protein